jgi:DNA-binding response OmpR family regulator
MGHTARIAVCDDDPLLLDLVSFRLEREDYEIEVFENGLDALDALRGSTFDLLILDAMMAGMDGFEVLTLVRSDAKLKNLPIIMLSARNGDADIVGALRNGADDYIVKPFIPDELAIRLERLIRQKKVEAAAAAA